MKWILPLLLLSFACSRAPIKAPEAPTDVIATLPTKLPGEPRVVFSAKSDLPYIHEVARISSCVVNNEEFLKEVESFPKYDYTDKSSKDVAENLKNSRNILISTYKTKSPWSKVIATTYKSDRKTIYFNTRKNPRKMEYMVNTAIHEGLHLLGWSHGDNSSKGKSKSVNYAVGDMSEKYVKDCKKI